MHLSTKKDIKKNLKGVRRVRLPLGAPGAPPAALFPSRHQRMSKRPRNHPNRFPRPDLGPGNKFYGKIVRIEPIKLRDSRAELGR